MANIYVRKSGNDSNDGSTPALAKLTIENAFAAASNSDKIIFGSGVYSIQTRLDDNTKNIDFYGDTTGELTGDAGEIIFDGLNSSTYAYINYGNYNVFNLSTTVKSNFENIIFQNFKVVHNQYIGYFYLIYARFGLKNCSFYNNVAMLLRPTNVSSIENVLIKDTTSFEQNVNAILLTGSVTLDVNNLIIDNVCTRYNGRSYVHGIKIDGKGCVLNIENSTIKNINANYDVVAIGVGRRSGSWTGSGDATVNMSNCNFINNGIDVNLTGGNLNWYVTIENSNSYNSFASSSGWTGTNLTNLPEHLSLSKEKLSKFSLLKGIGSTTFPTTDIYGNPRPSYGNGNACDIGAIESTSDIIQKESTIKDSGDYSVKVAPCNYFKKTFQVPVTASELRTVKVKIRIDGTWGTYRPRVSLSGQGMTLSQATKNSTTGAFEELTVSGTPTTSGIALLTIEAHSASTDAVLYIDTITIE